MTTIALPVGFAVFCWWFATGAIFYLNRLPRATYGRSMAAASAALALAFVGLAATRDDATAAGAYSAFVCGLLIWAWQEMSFLMGYLTGPRKQVCAHGCHGWRHFAHGTAAILYHELALLAGGAAVLALTWGAPNAVGAWTYCALWVMRQSAKVNLFLGVRNPGEALLPDHLQYLRGYFRRRAMNPLLPISVIGATAAALVFASRALEPAASSFQTASGWLLATLFALAAIEHLFLVLPLPLDALWQWSLKVRRAAAPLDHACGPASAALKAKS
jgi:putative photosynthetic complex assembly protein 2